MNADGSRVAWELLGSPAWPPAAGGAGAAAADGDGVVGGLTVRRFAGGHVEEAEALARAGAFMAPRLVLGREAKR